MLKGKNVIITGTSRGIGKAMLTAFARNGANIYAHARNPSPEYEEEIKKTADEYRVEIWPLYFDLTDYAMMKQCVKEIRASKCPIHALVNNAGVMYNALFQMSSEEQLRKQFEINFFSVFIFTQYISKIMVGQKFGSIVNLASTVAMDGNPGKSVYGATKASIISMTKSIASELGELGIRANCIAPGAVETHMLDMLSAQVIEQSRNSAALRRLAAPEEIADTAVYLASDKSSYITGQVIRVDGGLKS
jgi:3-oxoacyl-[acyl-carrier protein] reductase